MRLGQLREAIKDLADSMEVYVYMNAEGFEVDNRFDLCKVQVKCINHSTVHTETVLILEGDVS